MWGGEAVELVGFGEHGEAFIISMIEEGWDYLSEYGVISFIIPKTRHDTLIAVEEYLNQHNFEYDIVGVQAGNRTRFIYRIFKKPLKDTLRLSEMD